MLAAVMIGDGRSDVPAEHGEPHEREHEHRHHPRAHERAFVLVPWLDIDPKGEIAGHGPIAELIDDVDVSGVVRRADIVINANTGF